MLTDNNGCPKSGVPTTYCRARGIIRCIGAVHLWTRSCRKVHFIINEVRSKRCIYLSVFLTVELLLSALTDISKSIAMYLHDEQSKYRVLAIDLCSRGFQVWQHYIDAMDILRALFTLATNTSKQAITAQNVGAQARLAVLQIASSSTPLFMTKLGLDILHPQSVEHRKCVMQIVAFLIRKVNISLLLSGVHV